MFLFIKGKEGKDMAKKLLLKDVFNSWAKLMAENDVTCDYFTAKDIDRINNVLGEISVAQLRKEFKQMAKKRPWLADTTDIDWNPTLMFEVANGLTTRNEELFPALTALYNMNNHRYEYSAVFYPELYTEWFNQKYVNVD